MVEVVGLLGFGRVGVDKVEVDRLEVGRLVTVVWVGELMRSYVSAFLELLLYWGLGVVSMDGSVLSALDGSALSVLDDSAAVGFFVPFLVKVPALTWLSDNVAANVIASLNSFGLLLKTES